MTDNQPAGLAAALKKSLRELAQTFAAFFKAPAGVVGNQHPLCAWKDWSISVF